MNKSQRILAVISLVAAGVGVPLAVQQTATTAEVEPAEVLIEVEDAVIDAAYTLKELGRTPAQVIDELSRASGVAPDVVANLARRSTLADGRDPRAVRSESLAFVLPASEAPAVAGALAGAFCAPLTLGDGLEGSYMECVESRKALGGKPLCGKDGDVAGYLVQTHATPSQAQRARDIVVPLAEDVRDRVELALDSRGWWHCGQTRTPDASEPAASPNLSGDPL